MQRSHISTSILGCVICSILLLVSIPASAQQPKKTVEQPKDSTAFFRGVAVGVDAVGIIQRAVSDYGQYEASVRFNLKDKYFPVVEVGLGTADATDETTDMRFKTKAPYFRMGCDFNILKNKHDIYRLYLGVRYAFTYYKYDLYGKDLQDPVWGGTSPYGAEGVSCNFHWMEVVFGTDAKIWGPIRMGWSLRYQRRLFHNDGEYGNTWYVPGFGRQDNGKIGATFNVTFEI